MKNYIIIYNNENCVLKNLKELSSELKTRNCLNKKSWNKNRKIKKNESNW